MTDLPKIGVSVLETLTTGLYIEPYDSIREYIQNAADSIFETPEDVLKPRERRISIYLEEESHFVSIKDNGHGLKQSEFRDTLTNIGMSEKRFENNAGFRGIGRLAGIAYCDRLVFRSTAVGDSFASTLDIDCTKLRSIMGYHHYDDKQELNKIFSSCCTINTDKCKTDEHFFEVRMEGVLPQFELFFNCKQLEEYLSEVAPVDFDSQRFVFASEIKSWCKTHNIQIPIVKLTIKTPITEREVFKPYKNTYRTQSQKRGNYEFEIKGIEYFPSEVNPDSPYWIWYAKTDLLGIVDDDKSAGFRLRKFNISLGNENRVTELFSSTSKTNARFNTYYIGEIHVLAVQAIPNARRDGFEDNETWASIKASLAPFVRARVEEIRWYSQQRNRPIVKLEKSVDNVVGELAEFIQLPIHISEDRDVLIDKAQDVIDTLGRAAEGRIDREGDLIKINELKKKINDNLAMVKKIQTEGAEGFKGHLDRRQRKIVKEILSKLRSVLDQDNYKKAVDAISDLYGSAKD